MRALDGVREIDNVSANLFFQGARKKYLAKNAIGSSLRTSDSQNS